MTWLRKLDSCNADVSRRKCKEAVKYARPVIIQYVCQGSKSTFNVGSYESRMPMYAIMLHKGIR